MHNILRAATVLSMGDDGELLVLKHECFRSIVMASAIEWRLRHEQVLSKVPLLALICDYDHQTIADTLEESHHSTDTSDFFFFFFERGI